MAGTQVPIVTSVNITCILACRLQLLGCTVVAGVAVIAIIQHHVHGAHPGMVGLAISYALGITGKLSGLVTTFTGRD